MTKSILMIFSLFVLTAFGKESKLQICMFWENNSMVFGAIHGFLPSFFIKPSKDSSYYFCVDTLNNEINICYNTKGSVILDSAYGFLDSIKPNSGHITYEDTIINHNKIECIKKPLLLSEGIKSELARINRHYDNSPKKDTIILGIKFNTTNKALLFCTNCLYQNGYRNICIYENDKRTFDANGAFEIIDKSKIASFASLKYDKLNEIKNNIASIRNKLILFK